MRSSPGGWLAKRAEGEVGALCAVEGDDDARRRRQRRRRRRRSRRSDRHRRRRRRATSSWRRPATKERVAVVNDATWQLVKKLVTLTVPLCERRLLETPFWLPPLCFEPSLFPRRRVNYTRGACATGSALVVAHANGLPCISMWIPDTTIRRPA